MGGWVDGIMPQLQVVVWLVLCKDALNKNVPIRALKIPA